MSHFDNMSHRIVSVRRMSEQLKADYAFGKEDVNENKKDVKHLKPTTQLSFLKSVAVKCHKACVKAP